MQSIIGRPVQAGSPDGPAPFHRRKARRRLGLKHLPELTFVPDRSIEHGSRIASLLRELPEEGEPGAEPRSTTDTREKDGAE